MGETAFKDLFKSRGKVLAEVINYNPTQNTYQVITRGGVGPREIKRQTLNLPLNRRIPGQIAPLFPGTTVEVSYASGQPVISNIFSGGNTYTMISALDPTTPDLGGQLIAEAFTPSGSPRNFREPGVPIVMPGDWAQTTPDGNFLALLRGKLNILHGSERSQIITSGLQDLVRIVSENYEHFTSLGFTTIENTDGRCSLKFRAAADQIYESGGTEQSWTFKLDLYGDSGNAFDLEVCENEGKTMARITISTDGKIEFYGVNGIQFVNAGAGPVIEENGSDKLMKVYGDLTHDITGAITESGVKKTVKCSENHTLLVGNDCLRTVNRNKSTSIGGNQAIKVMGGTIPDLTNIAVDYQVGNGSFVLDIGNPLSFPQSIAAFPGFKVIVHNGAVNIGLDPLATPLEDATINLITNKPGKIALGGTTMTCTDNACKYNFFQAMMKVLIKLLDSHTHTTAWGMSGPAQAPTPSGFDLAVTPLVETVKSQFVKLYPA